ncbi:MAG: hypothetical protein A3F18_03420 [Legionellales bacterium RIFCSPHIGHO2_12_FULL_37_14]|nr:MAG: hypothetical protein A3F18_03420 [Legionellales bacterium RIFCSPHIGHO2_12_FULL_37_14]
MPHGVTASITELIALRQRVVNGCLNHKHTANQAGVIRSVLRGRGMEFSEVRNYQAGDEIRHMEWRVTARTGRPHIKLFHAERERPVLFVVDFNPSMFFGTQYAFKSVTAARLCAILAWQAFEKGDKVGGICFSSEKHQEFIPKAREAYLLKFLGQVAAFTETPLSMKKKPKPLSEALLKIRRVTKPGSLIILVSDFYAFDNASDAHLISLRKHHDILAFHVCDPLEIKAPKPGIYPFTDGKEYIHLDTTNNSMCNLYKQLFEQRHKALSHRCQKLGVIYSQVESQKSLLTFLQHTNGREQNAK